MAAEDTNEESYLRLVRRVITEGEPELRERTGKGTRKLPGVQLRWDLTDSSGTPTVPALTCRKLALRWIGEELLWFIRGDTDAKTLSARGVHIWDANTTAAFLKKRGLSAYEPGMIGPGYGWQWRHGGAPYMPTADTDKAPGGIDQLAEVFAGLRSDPGSRRLLVNSWSVSQLDEMALPPCHYAFQFVVAGSSVHCVVSMRSGDLGLGIPYNCVSYALLTHLAALYADLTPGEVIINISDAHVYEDHVVSLESLPPPRSVPPTVIFKDAVIAALDASRATDTETTVLGPVYTAGRFLDTVGDLKATEAFAYAGYNPGPAVKMEMAV